MIRKKIENCLFDDCDKENHTDLDVVKRITIVVLVIILGVGGIIINSAS